MDAIMTTFPIEDAARNGHDDGRTVILLTAEGEVPGFYDDDDTEPGWISVEGADLAMQVTPAPKSYRLPTDQELSAIDEIDRIPPRP